MRKHVTAGNITDAPEKISEGAAKGNRTAGTRGMTGCRILSPSTSQVSHKKKQDQTGKILSIGKLYRQGNSKAKPPESETCTQQGKKSTNI